ncbi:MAG: L-2-amino-thiazoline-4-carboxylic acid hydrolase [bacterium]|nr:MAG: L-2-amino-thiazoline-4-carboxylic acid hydrolase [bacterium]
MEKKILSDSLNSNGVLTNLLSTGAMFCLGHNNLLGTSRSHKKQNVSTAKHKFFKKSGMSFEEVFQFKYGPYISTMQRLANIIGRDKFIEMLKKVSSEVAEQRVKNIIRNLPKTDLDTFINTMLFTPLFKNTLSMEVVKKTDKVLEIKITECLWAKTVRELNEPDAVDIGYALICYPELDTTEAFNPKLKIIHTKTLMQGHDCCNSIIMWKG